MVPVRAVLYARVSSAAQRERHTIASQLEVLPRYVAEQGWDLVRPPDTYVDDGRSAKAGTLSARSGLEALFRDAASGIFDVVAVVDIDRLTRSDQWGERGYILGALQSAGVQIAIASTGQLHDFGESQSDLMLAFGLYSAADENRKRRERTMRGKERALAAGKKPAGPTPYGLRYDRESGAWSLDQERAPIVREMFEKVAAGETLQSIATALNVRGVSPGPRASEWRLERVRDIVHATTYRGEWIADKRRRLVVPVPVIVTDDLWYRAHDSLRRWGKRGLRRTRHVYLVEGLGRCRYCEARIGINRNRTIRRGKPVPNSYYLCSHRRRPPAGEGSRCPLPFRRTEEVDGRLWEAVHDLLTRRWAEIRDLVAEERRVAAEASEGWAADVAGYQAHLERLGKAEEVLLAQFRRGRISEAGLDRELGALGRERLWVRRQLETAKRATATPSDARDDIATLKGLRAAVRRASPEVRRDIVQALIPAERGCHVVLGASSVEAVLGIAPSGARVGLVGASSWSTADVADQPNGLITLRIVA